MLSNLSGTNKAGFQRQLRRRPVMQLMCIFDIFHFSKALDRVVWDLVLKVFLRLLEGASNDYHLLDAARYFFQQKKGIHMNP
jgi:hypothetical protein